MTPNRRRHAPRPTPFRAGGLTARLALALLLLGLAWGARAAEVRLGPADAAGRWGPALQAASERALARAEARLGLKLDQPAKVFSLPDELAFEREVGERLDHIVAIARSEPCEIIINRPALLRESPPRQEQILTHEMSHLLVGRGLPGRLPAWLDEGLAMTVAGESDSEGDWRILLAGALDTLIPVERLMDRVALGEGKQELAYAQSREMTQFYIKQQFPETKGADPRPLIQTLTDPETGAKRIRMLWDPVFVRSLDYYWRQSHHTLWSLVMLLSGSSVLWIAISLLFLVAWWRKRRLTRGIRERFEREEHWDAEFGEGPKPWLEPPDWEPTDEDEAERRF